MDSIHFLNSVIIAFVLAGIIDSFILYFAIKLYKEIGDQGYLPKMTLFAGISVFILCLHHILEIILPEDQIFVILSETIETISLFILLLASYQLYKLATVD